MASSQQNYISFTDFTGGINDNIDPEVIQDNQLQSALNMRLDKTGTLESRGGQLLLTTAVSSTSPIITSIFGATLSTGSSVTIVTVANSSLNAGLFYQIDSANTFTSLTKDTGVTGNYAALWRWVFFNDVLIGVADTGDSGNWPVVYWDGATATVSILPGTTSANITSPTDIAIWNRRVCISQGTDLYISDAGTAYSWLGGDSQVFRFKGSSSDEERITAIHEFRGQLIVFKPSSIWAIDPGDGLAQNFTITQIAINIGCNSRLSVQDVGRDLLFVNQAGINSIQDIRDQGGLAISGRVSQNIYRTIWSLIDTTNLQRAVSIYNPELEEYMVSLPQTGAAQNDVVVMLNIQYTIKNGYTSLWKYSYGKKISCFAHRPGTPRTLIDVGSYDGNIYRINTGVLDAGDIFLSSFKTKQYNFGNVVENKIIYDLTLNLTQGNDYPNNLTIFFNNETRNITDSVNVFGLSSKWDEATWNYSSWSISKSGIKRKYISIPCRNISIEIETSPVLSTDAGALDFTKIVFDLGMLTEDLTLT